MNKNKIPIESLSMDLLRVALGYHKDSIQTAERFSEEAIMRTEEIDKSEVEPYFAKVLDKIKDMFENVDASRIAEDALMYSIICKNYANKFFHTSA